MQRLRPRHISVGLAALVAALLSGVGSSQPPAEPGLVVVGRLAKIARAPDCGIFYFGSVALYKDLRVVSGSYHKKKVEVIHGCIELRRDDYNQSTGDFVEFKVGERHRMRLVAASRFEGTVFGPKRVRRAKRYFCEHVTLEQPDGR